MQVVDKVVISLLQEQQVHQDQVDLVVGVVVGAHLLLPVVLVELEIHHQQLQFRDIMVEQDICILVQQQTTQVDILVEAVVVPVLLVKMHHPVAVELEMVEQDIQSLLLLHL